MNKVGVSEKDATILKNNKKVGTTAYNAGVKEKSPEEAKRNAVARSSMGSVEKGHESAGQRKLKQRAEQRENVKEKLPEVSEHRARISSPERSPARAKDNVLRRVSRHGGKKL